MPPKKSKVDKATRAREKAQKRIEQLDDVIDTEFLEKLTIAQRSAATHPSSDALQILAGPGSGKTRTLTSRVAWLIQSQDHSPEELVVVTFTNKAAREMQERLARIVGKEDTLRLNMGTFHSLGLRLLRKYAAHVPNLEPRFSVLDDSDCESIMKTLVNSKSIQLPKWLSSPLKPRTLRNQISTWKRERVSPQEARVKFSFESNDVKWPVKIAAVAYEKYEQEKEKNNALDFDDLVLKAVELMAANPFITQGYRHGESAEMFVYPLCALSLTLAVDL